MWLSFTTEIAVHFWRLQYLVWSSGAVLDFRLLVDLRKGEKQSPLPWASFFLMSNNCLRRIRRGSISFVLSVFSMVLYLHGALGCALCRLSVPVSLSTGSQAFIAGTGERLHLPELLQRPFQLGLPRTSLDRSISALLLMCYSEAAPAVPAVLLTILLPSSSMVQLCGRYGRYSFLSFPCLSLISLL